MAVPQVPNCHPDRKHAAQGLCNACYSGNWYAAHPEAYQRKLEQNRAGEAQRQANLKKYGLSVSQYEELLENQGGACALCGDTPTNRRLAVDHDHATGIVRGLLCKNCNVAISSAENDPGWLDRAAIYLRGN